MLVLAALLSATGPALAVGYHLVKVDALAGVNDDASLESGIGVSLYSDELAWWITLADPRLESEHRVNQWWLESRYRGPVMGIVPPALELVEGIDRLEEEKGDIWVPFRFWRIGTDHTTHRALEWDWSTHRALSLPGLAGADPRRLLFGPTIGLGANLTWWEQWRDQDDSIVNTGKITLEGGWVAGFTLNDVVYSQSRATLAMDLFGVHQANLNMVGLVGVFLGRLRVPLGLEISGEMDSGNDTSDLALSTLWSARAALVYRMQPAAPDDEVKELLENMRRLIEAQEERYSGPLPPDSPSSDPTVPAPIEPTPAAPVLPEEPAAPQGAGPGAPPPATGSGTDRGLSTVPVAAPAPAEVVPTPASEPASDEKEKPTTGPGEKGPSL